MRGGSMMMGAQQQSRYMEMQKLEAGCFMKF